MALQDVKFVCNKCGHTEFYKCKYGDRVCAKCENHQSTDGHTHNFCYCGWNKQNFDPADAGERWDDDY